jgi:threonine dehydratase
MTRGTKKDTIRLADIFAARSRIAGIAWRTPLVPSQSLSARIGGEVRLKLETLQDTGAFKVRGAANAVLSLSDDARARGIVTYSTGNHGRAVAYVARRVGSPATVCVSRQVTPGKIAALEATGCCMRIEGSSQDEAAKVAEALEAQEGLSVIDPINDADVIAGHGTIGLELLEDAAELDTVVVPLSGGGLISGIALAIKSANPDCRVVGVSMDRGAAMFASQEAGRPVLVEEVTSLADSLQGGILLDNRYSFAMVRDLVDEILLVEEDEIAKAMAHAYWNERLILEGAGATPIAALMFRDRAKFGARVALVLTGNAVDGAVLAEIAMRHRDAVAPDAQPRAA